MGTKRVTEEQASSAPHWPIGEFAARVGVSVATLKRWDRLGILIAARWPSGRRFYTEKHLQQALGEPPRRAKKKPSVPPGGTPNTADPATE